MSDSATLWTTFLQVPLSMEFLSQEEYQSGLPCPPLDPGIEPVFLMLPALISGFFTTTAIWEALQSIKL